MKGLRSIPISKEYSTHLNILKQKLGLKNLEELIKYLESRADIIQG